MITSTCRQEEFASWALGHARRQVHRYGLLRQTPRTLTCWTPGPRQEPVILKAFFDEDGHSRQREIDALRQLSGLQGTDVPQLLTTLELRFVQFPMPTVALQCLPGQTAEELGMDREWFHNHPTEGQAVLDMYRRVWDAGVVHGDADYSNWMRVPGAGHAVAAGLGGDASGDAGGGDAGDASGDTGGDAGRPRFMLIDFAAASLRGVDGTFEAAQSEEETAVHRMLCISTPRAGGSSLHTSRAAGS